MATGPKAPEAAKPAASPRQAATPAPVAAPKPAVTTGSVTDRPSLPLTNVGVVHIELLPMQGEAEKCGLDAGALQAASTYPVAASARLKVARGTLTHMHVRLSAVYVRRLEHCIVNADVRVSSLQSVELQHSKTTVPLYVPLWEKADVRLVPRAQAQKLAEERLRKISEQFLIDWAAQN